MRSRDLPGHHHPPTETGDDIVEPDPGPLTGPLRLAIITDRAGIRAWQARALASLPDDSGIVAVRVVVPDASEPTATARGTRLRRLVVDRYRRHLERPGRALAPHALEAVARGVPVVTGALEPGVSGRLRLPDALVAHLRRAGCDCVVNATMWPVEGVPSSALPFGVWEQRVAAGHADTAATDRTARCDGRPQLLRVSLVQAGAPGDRDRVLQDGVIASVPHSVAATVDTAYDTTVGWLARTCREIQRSGHLSVRDRPAPRPTILTDGALLRALARSPGRKLWRVLRAPFVQEEWRVGIIDRPVDEVFRSGTLGAPRWMGRPSRRQYLADPFAVEGHDAILVEAYDYLTHRGHIAVVDEDHADRPVPSPVLEADGHMSYPYLFRHDRDIYCVPETCDQRRVTLYRAVDFPHRWQPVAVMVDDFAATDATVIRHGTRFWLFCTDNELGGQTNLHVYHAETLNGPWTPHVQNPVKIDVRSARPAGTPFVTDGRLIRPAQDSSKGYGSAVVFNEVTHLTPDTFAERPVRRLDPSPDGPFRHGIHTVTRWGDRTLVDGKRRGFSLITLAGLVGRQIRGR